MKTLFTTTAAAFALAFATPALAQDRMTLPFCETGLAQLEFALGEGIVDADVQLDDESWCLIEDAQIATDADLRLTVDQVRWRGADMARLVEQGLPPRSFEITVTGIRFMPQSGDPKYDYLLGLPIEGDDGMRFAAELRWDGVQNALIIEEGAFAFDEANTIDLSGRIDGVDLTDLASIQTSLGTAGLRSLTVKSQFDGWFESQVALILGSSLLQEGDVPPQVQVEALKAQAIEFMETSLSGVLPGPTQEAVGAFITALPHPRGIVQVQLNAEPTIGMARLMTLAPLLDGAASAEQFETAMDGITVSATWAPEKETP